MFISNKIVNIADIMAIPGFFLLINYFYKKKKKTNMEKFLLIFSISGFLFDTIFTINFLKI